MKTLIFNVICTDIDISDVFVKLRSAINNISEPISYTSDIRDANEEEINGWKIVQDYMSEL